MKNQDHENQPADDLHDRLIDRALRETLGGETPPDLTERILAASRGASAEPVSPSTQQPDPQQSSPQQNNTRNVSTGEIAMNEQPLRARRVWLTIAVAASLLVMAGLLFPALQAPRESAQEGESAIANGVLVSDGERVATNEESKLKNMEVAEQTQKVIGDVTAELKRLASEREEGTPYQIELESILQPEGENRSGPQPSNEVWEEIAARRARGVVQKESLNKSLALPAEESRHPRAALAVAKSPASGPASTQYYVAPSDEPLGVTQSDAFNTGVAPSTTWDSQRDSVRFRFFERTRGSMPEAWKPEGFGGRGAGRSGDKYTQIHENPFVMAQGEDALSTFSIDVDTASYANVRQFLMQQGQLPPADAVRIEELVNYFDYDYDGPTGDVPFASHVEVADCPWNAEHRLVRIGIKGREIDRRARPQSNLVFLVDVSGSMNEPAKLPLLVEGMKMLTRELGENDRVAIVVYASSEGVALESTRGDQQQEILAALEMLRAGGSTAGGKGIELAYKIAKDNFIEGGVNRVILATDGDFNVGVTNTADLERLAETEAKQTGVFLTVLGFGRGNLNDAMMEAISGKGNGNYHYVDNQSEARKVLVEEMSGTLVTIAKDVKIQVEFNPSQVAGYRLIGYENRVMAAEDFNDDKKDAGEIGAGHTVTALYEVVPAGQEVVAGKVDALKYQQTEKQRSEVEDAPQAPAEASDELLTLKIRYKQPEGNKSVKLEFPITDSGDSFSAATADFKFAAAVASFGMLLRDSQYRGETSYDAVLEIAQNGIRGDANGHRAEFLDVVRQAKQLAGD